MEDIIESMMKGDDIYPRSFVVARKFWEEFYNSHADDENQELQKAIDDAQMPFQWKLEEETGLIPPPLQKALWL